MTTIPMTSLTYLKEESEKRFESTIKPNLVNSEALAIFNTLTFSDNLEMGYAKVEFEVDASNFSSFIYLFMYIFMSIFINLIFYQFSIRISL